MTNDDLDRQAELIGQAGSAMLQNYRQQPIVLERGEGMWLYDVDGRRYLDMTAGIAVCALGHSHPALRSAVADQAAKLLHCSNLYYNEQQILAASAITARCFGDRVFFCNSGAEANEAALKLARRYMHVVAGEPQRQLVVATHGSFHGRSIATLSVTGQEKYRADLGRLFEPVQLVPFGDLEAAAEVLGQRTACCFIVEPIQAEGGIVVPPDGYLAGLRQICDRTGTLLIFDEVQTGVGRTGKLFAHEWDGVAPDAMTLAKALGGGVPIGALVASEKAAQGLTFHEGGAVPHASTFGGNPLACAAAVCVLETLEAEALVENCRQAGDYLAGELERLVGKHTGVASSVRGRGLLCGLGLSRPAAPVVAACRERGVLLSVAGGTVVRFAPPLIVRKQHIDQAVSVLDGVLTATRGG